MAEEQISKLVDQGMAAYGDTIEETDDASSGCVSEQMSIVPIVNAFANAYIKLPDRIKNTK